MAKAPPGARLARHAVELGGDDAVVLARAGSALTQLAGDLDGGIALLDQAKLLNPNLAAAWFLGCLGAAAGALAVFRTENEVGSATLLLAGAAFLVMAT